MDSKKGTNNLNLAVLKNYQIFLGQIFDQLSVVGNSIYYYRIYLFIFGNQYSNISLNNIKSSNYFCKGQQKKLGITGGEYWADKAAHAASHKETYQRW